MKRRLSLLTATAAALALVALAAFVAVTKAEGPSGVTAMILARGHYDGFNIRSDPHGTIAGFRAHSTAPIDIIVRQHDYAVGSTTGWHSHPGPIFITVTKGTLTYYESDDPTCTPHVVSADSPEQCVRRHWEWARRAEPERPARSGHQRDHCAGGRSVPHESRCAQSLLRFLTSLQTAFQDELPAYARAARLARLATALNTRRSSSSLRHFVCFQRHWTPTNLLQRGHGGQGVAKSGSHFVWGLTLIRCQRVS